MQKKPRRKYVAQPKIDDEKPEFEDISQFRMVIHAPKYNLENICDNVDFIGLKNIDFGKIGREHQNMIEEFVYAMMEKFKNTPLEFDNTMPKELYTIYENKWHYCLNMENEIRESMLAEVMSELSEGQITKANKKYGSKFAPKYRIFNIFQKKIEDFVKKSKQMWRLIYRLTTVKEGQENPVEGRNNEEEGEEKEEEK